MTTVIDNSKVCYVLPSNVIKVKPRINLILTTLHPKCIVHHRFPQPGDTITYDPTDCTRLGDGATTTFSLDSDGVPTVVGVTGTFGHEWGVYGCTVSLNGNSEVVYISHTEDATHRASFTFGTQDVNGWTDITPPSGARLLYVDPAALDDVSWGPTGNGTDYYTGASPPAGGWKTPSSVNAFKTMAAAYAEMRDGQADYMLLLDTATHVPAATISFNGKSGTSASARLMITSYGTTGNGRAHINPTHSSAILDVFFEANVGFTDLDIYPTFHDPSHGDWNGWGVDTPPDTGITVYTGGGAGTTVSGILIENCHIRYCTTGISLYGNGGLTDTIIRRNIIEWNFDETDNAQGISVGGRRTAPLEYPEWAYYIGENVLDHNGWYKRAYGFNGTGVSGSTTTLVVTATEIESIGTTELAGVALRDTTNGGHAYITTVSEATPIAGQSTINFAVTTNVDFTSAQAYEIGSDISTGPYHKWGGLATIFNHGMYVRYSGDAIIENNIITRSSSISIKNTADSADAAEELDTANHPTDGLIEQWNYVNDAEIGLGGSGNDDFNSGSSFTNMRTCDNVCENLSASDPTNRNASAGNQFVDHRNSLMAGNIVMSVSDVAIFSPYGFSLSGHTINTVLANNIAYNASKNTTDVLGGSLRITPATPGFSDVYIYNNDFVERGSAVVVGNYPSAQDANFTWANNRYDATRAAASAVNIDSSSASVATLVSTTGETGSSTATINYTDEGASIENFQLNRGGTATLADFLTDAKAQSKSAGWDATIAAEKIVAEMKRSLTDRPDIIFEVAHLRLTNGVVDDVQNISFSNVGIPKGAIFIKPNTRDGLGVRYAASGGSVGYADADGNQWFTHNNLDTELTPAQKADARQYDGAIAGFADRGEWSLTDTNFFTNNQISIKLTNKGFTSEAFDLFVVAIGGADVDSVKVGNYDDLGTGTAQQEIAVGHKPDLFFATTTFHTAINGPPDGADEFISALARQSTGCAIRGESGIEQMCLTRYNTEDTLTNTSSTNGIYNDSILAKTTHPTTENFSVSVDAMTSNGVVISCDAAPSNDVIGYMSVSFKKRPKMKMVDTTIATASNISITDVGFKGGFCFWMNLIGSTAYNTAEAISHSAGMTVSDGTNIYTANQQAPEGVLNIDANAGGYGNSGLELLEKGATTLSLEIASSSFSFTNTGIDSTLSTQSGENIPGRVLVMGIN